MKEIARENDEKLRDIGQKYLNNIAKYLKEHKIDTRKYPLNLRHNDYSGLSYEKRGENDYTAYVVVE